jgi:SSS family solute:Na+ symporter
VFDFLTCTTGLYARAALPNLEQPVLAFPLLAEAILPSIAKGLFYVGMLATIMSTLNTYAFISAQTLGKDLLWRWKGEIIEDKVNLYTRVGLLVTGASAVILALLIPSVINIWYTIGTVIIPGLLIPLVASYFDGLRPSPTTAYVTMFVGWVVALSALVYGYVHQADGMPHYVLGIEPMYPGLAASLIVYGIGKVFSVQR